MVLQTQQAEDPRQRVLHAAMLAISSRGLDRVRMLDIGELAGMSPGHVLYYFGTKEQILLDTLAWSEAELGERRRRAIASAKAPARKLVRFIEIYLPEGRADPRWSLWAEVWTRSQASDRILEAQGELERAWWDDLVKIVDLGVGTGRFAEVDPDEFSEWLLALLDGLAVQVLIGAPRMDRERALLVGLRAAGDDLGVELLKAGGRGKGR